MGGNTTLTHVLTTKRNVSRNQFLKFNKNVIPTESRKVRRATIQHCLFSKSSTKRSLRVNSGVYFLEFLRQQKHFHFSSNLRCNRITSCTRIYSLISEVSNVWRFSTKGAFPSERTSANICSLSGYESLV